jgi:undecaprenyl-diphosphatase
MTLWQGVLLGILQGVTEFLPVSSSGHLALAQMLIPGFEQPGVVFDALLHTGTAFAVVWYERRQISEWYRSASGRLLLGLLFVGTAATAIIALPLRNMAEQAFERPVWVGLALIVTGLVVGATRFLRGGSVGERETTWRQSVLVGLVQGVAIFPGLSRSGTTIAVGLGGGLERSWAARFSFLLSVPANAAVTVVEIVETRSGMVAAGNGFGLAAIAGGLAAGITGYFALQVVIRTVSSRIFHRFAWYCIPLGILVVALTAGGR